MAARRPVLALLTMLAVAAIAACGGDDDSPAAGDTGPSTTASVAAVTTSEPTDPTEPTDAPVEPSVPRTFEPAPTQPELVGTTSPPPGTGAPIGDDATANLAKAVADLAGRLDVEPATILVVSEENVTWRDGSIGCPQPGVNYIQSLVDGVRIVLDHDGTQYSYHAGGSRTIFYCATPVLPGD